MHLPTYLWLLHYERKKLPENVPVVRMGSTYVDNCPAGPNWGNVVAIVILSLDLYCRNFNISSQTSGKSSTTGTYKTEGEKAPESNNHTYLSELPKIGNKPSRETAKAKREKPKKKKRRTDNMGSEKPSILRQTALAMIDAYNAWDIEAMIALRSEDCVQQIIPKSLNRPGLNNEAYRAWFASIMPYFEAFTAEVLDLVEDAAHNKVTVWARSTASTPIGPYANEYMLLFHMNEAGDKITRFYEFVDTVQSNTFFPRLREHIAAQKTAATAA
ncbi:hypothetical protein F5Y17DRAFT_420636 [Xylariaceae sp. FL0594]|nr:hypothetical protein F5Y17DRAFT_420636 [Xylariaceae sp. FL0594]